MTGIQIICEGLAKDVLTPGDGETFPSQGDTVMVHYTGKLAEDGSTFDTTRGEWADTCDGITVMKKKRPFSFVVGQGSVIAGWEAGIPTMSLGERALFRVQADLAYGEKAVACGSANIAAGSDLVFDIVLLAVGKQYAHRSLW
eukprot:GGOE01046075.1.p1 GENE.GGOE01046075.1~~GGOE01046075.1.p1  ORF type:complete len:155 (+),score=31.66 GGOE01046075.1:37-465(+)